MGYGLYRLHLSERLIGDKFLVGSAVGRVEESRGETNHIGLIARFYLKQNRYYFQTNLTYGDESSALGAINLQPQEYFFPGNSGLDYKQELIQFGGLFTYNRTVKSSITGGRELLHLCLGYTFAPLRGFLWIIVLVEIILPRFMSISGNQMKVLNALPKVHLFGVLLRHFVVRY